jgi:hypothetical protein
MKEHDLRCQLRNLELWQARNPNEKCATKIAALKNKLSLSEKEQKLSDIRILQHAAGMQKPPKGVKKKLAEAKKKLHPKKKKGK